MKQQFRVIGSVALNLLLLETASANNVVVSNPTLTGTNIGSQFTLVQFDITWENSWRDTMNWDAAWVFVKYSADGGPWSHATLATSGHTVPSGSTIDTPGDGKGVFIYRDAIGSGTNAFTGVQLRWEYGTDGVADNAVVQVKLFAIEMVFVPMGSFFIGDRTTFLNVEGQFHDASSTTTPFQVTSEVSLLLGGTMLGNVGNNNASGMRVPDDFNDTTTQTLPATFPKGFDAFYSMKYEITQEQYRDFLNCLTYEQQSTRTATSPNSAAGMGALSSTNLIRNGIDIQTPGMASTTPAVYANNLYGDDKYNENNDGQNIACNYLTPMDGCAYADWAGLRPMTELEFEKACRGNQSPVANEFAWGTTSRTGPAGITNDGAENEVPSNAGANCNFGGSGTDGPLRVGCFATSSSSREQAGASFYGIMELSGNVWERPVSIGNASGRNFTGTVGDGSLSTNGNATNSDWPGFSSGEVTGAIGSGFRGAGWDNADFLGRVSDRNIASDDDTRRQRHSGFRCVRPGP